MKDKKAFPHELVGEEVCVVKSTQKENVGITGIIVDETKSTLRIAHNDKIKILLKGTLQLKLIKSGIIVDGKILIKRPEERLK